jgi:hypothetical protein
MSANPARFLSLGNLMVFSPLGLSFVDDFTGKDPVGFINATLQVESAPNSGAWQATGVRGLFTPSRILAYPNLGRRGQVPNPAEAPRNFRVLIDTQYYDPLYSVDSGAMGVVFKVTPYDDDSDFTTLKPTMVTLPLLPRANYPFAGVPTFLRGQAKGASGKAVAALVTAAEAFDDSGSTKQTRILADAGGTFGLPLRWGNANQPTKVTATGFAANQTATINLNFPYVLTNPTIITIPNL